jgi:uncharacterized protein with HEPN domain
LQNVIYDIILSWAAIISYIKDKTIKISFTKRGLLAALTINTTEIIGSAKKA